MPDTAEFYLACNPPLLPRGVSEVIRRVQNEEGLLEILFEPHGPWFKCIAFSPNKQQICTAIEENLLAIADEDVDTLDMPETTEADISIISPDPRMIPWSEFSTAEADSIQFADTDVFPELIAELRYKTLWTGLENYSTVGFSELLNRCNSLLGPCATPQDKDEFEKLMKCKISYNMRESLLYIGSDESQEAIDKAVQKLDTLVHICHNMNRVQHQIVLDNEDGQHLAYKWLSHLGFHRSTYLQYQPDVTSSDSLMLMEAAAVRIPHMNVHGYWIPEPQLVTSSLPSTSSTDTDTMKLRNYDYKTTLDKRLHVSDEITFPDEQAGAIESWRDTVQKEARKSPVDTILPGRPESTPSVDIVNDDLFSALNSNEAGELSERGSSCPALMTDLLDDIPVNIKHTLPDIIRSTDENCGGTIDVDREADLIFFEEMHKELNAIASSPGTDADNLAFIPLGQNSEQDNTPEAIDAAIINVKTGDSSIDRTRKQQMASKIAHRQNLNSAASSIIEAAGYLQTAMHALKAMPGRVSIRLEFGRIFLKGVRESHIDTHQTLKFEVNEVLKQMKGVDGNCTGFSTTLSAKEDEISKLARIVPHGKADWELSETRVFYDLHCSFGSSANGCSVVEIDPERGTTCRTGFAQCFALYLHFPKDQWDLRLVGRQYYDLTSIEKNWIEGWLESSKVSKLAKGGLKFEFLDRPGNQGTVKGIVIRHVLLYKQSGSDTSLTITFSRKLNLVSMARQNAGPMVPVTWQTPKNLPQGKGVPDEWVEASLRSRVVDDWFDAEASPPVAKGTGVCEPRHDTPNYDEQLAGLSEMASSGGAMIKQMNSVGRYNNNGQCLDAKGISTQPLRRPSGKDKGSTIEYW